MAPVWTCDACSVYCSVYDAAQAVYMMQQMLPCPPPHPQVITVEDVNQENICCLNTALSLFILARSHGQLNLFIEALYRWEIANQQLGAVTGNFLALLKFWLEYYLYRGKDCLSLELSSNIHFSEWRCIVNELNKRLQPEALVAAWQQAKDRSSKDRSAMPSSALLTQLEQPSGSRTE